MAAEAENIRKQDDLTKIHNSDEFSNYVHAVTVPMKIVMAAIVVFFAGALAYCAFGQVPVTVSSVAVSDDECYCYVTSDDRDGINPGDEIQIEGETYYVGSISSGTVVVDESIDYYARQLGGLELDDDAYVITVEGSVPQGVYSATITKDYLNPLKVLLEG